MEIDAGTFQNDMVSFADKDDVITLLIHLGHLGHDGQRHTVFVPNEEIRQELLKVVKKKKWNELTAQNIELKYPVKPGF